LDIKEKRKEGEKKSMPESVRAEFPPQEDAGQ
jgi:hypothetical protein